MGNRLEPIDGLRGTKNKASIRLENVQILRGLAAVLVLLTHVGSIGFIFNFFPIFEVPHGIFGVDLFFVISGFIMVYTTRNAWGAPISFIAKRVYRIYPLWWLCLFVGYPEVLRYFTGFWDEYGSYYVKAVFLFPASTNRVDLYPPLVVGWALIYEMLFYIVFAAAMLFPRRWMFPLVGVTLLGLLAIGLALPARMDAAKFFGNPIYLEFVLGMAVGKAFIVGGFSRNTVVVVTMVGVASFGLMKYGDHLRMLYYGLPAVAVLVWALSLPAPVGFIGRSLTVIGDASYALYLSHGIAIMALASLLQKNLTILPVWAAMTVLIVAPVLAAIALHFAVERPLFELKRLIDHSRPAKRVTPNAA